MYLHQIRIELTSVDGVLRGREVTPAGLHGVFYDVIKRDNAEAATWLHGHAASKPYTLAPSHYDQRQRDLAGMLLTTLNEPSAETYNNTRRLTTD